MIRKSISYFLTVVVILSMATGLLNCQSDENPQANCHPLDPDEVNNRIGFPVNLNKVNTPFEGSNDITYNGYFITIQGGSFFYDFQNFGPSPLNTGIFAVHGANSYYTIELDTLPDSDTYFLQVDFPEDIQPGCITVITQENTRGVIEYPMKILARGGENTSQFDSKSWHLAYSVSPVEPDPLYADSLYHEIFQTAGLCANDIPTDYHQSSSRDIEFTPNSTYNETEKGYTRNIDFDNSTCEQLVYEESEFEFNYAGAWSYDNAVHELTLVYKYGPAYLPAVGYKVFQVDFSGDFMVLTLINYEGFIPRLNERTSFYFIEK